ncbi:hypothetical protein S40293_03285 [Stachybotrys chartarum IBT 40293]|nr:hypothetical protein S40293_03285 [Stachybotrys chartarum IBT 40293]
MDSQAAAEVEGCVPAPYGKSCQSCSRAKCKCYFLRTDNHTCERCHRLGRTCEPAVPVRRRRPRRPAAQSLPSPLSSTRTSGLEQKLDDIVSLLRSHATERSSQGMQKTVDFNNTPSSLGTLVDSVASRPPSPVRDPDFEIDTVKGFIDILRPRPTPTHARDASSTGSNSPIAEDVSAHQIPEAQAEEQLKLFKRHFLRLFPFVHLPMPAAELRLQKPFLWLTIMSLTSKASSVQFELEATIWNIITRRVVAQHYMDIDLLLGIIAFSAWSHYYKVDKPFMNKLTQLAVSLVFDMELHQENAPPQQGEGDASRLTARRAGGAQAPTLEERRTYLALCYLTSAYLITWEAYRKIEPLRWTPYGRKCLRILSEEPETPLDLFLAAQIRCQLLCNQVTCGLASEHTDDGRTTLSKSLFTALMRQLADIREGLPPPVLEMSKMCLLSTEFKIRNRYLDGLPKHENILRLTELESLLVCTERWLGEVAKWELAEWIGISVELFNQLTQCLIILFRLASVDEPNWDADEVRRRADVFQVLDHCAGIMDHVPKAVGMVDATGGRRGLFFKGPRLIRAIKTLMMAEMARKKPQSLQAASATNDQMIGQSDYRSGPEMEVMPASGVDLNIEYEPWLSDLFVPSWDFGQDLFNGYN